MTQDDIFLQHSEFEGQHWRSLKGSKEVYKIFWGKVFIKVILAVWNPHLMKIISDSIVIQTWLWLPHSHLQHGLQQRYCLCFIRWFLIFLLHHFSEEVDVCYWNVKFISFKVQRTICLLCPSSQTLTEIEFYCTKRPSRQLPAGFFNIILEISNDKSFQWR